MPTWFTRYKSPIGELTLVKRYGALERLELGACATTGWQDDGRAFTAETEWLDSYFAGEAPTRRVPVDLSGTPFQVRVWSELEKIPHGTTTTYGAIARSMGRPKAVRAVGGANHRNPVAIIVPCHRVIGSGGALVGYGGGLPMKKWLLQHERASLR